MELKIEHLSKQFKDKTAVNDVNLTLTLDSRESTLV